MNGKLMWRVKTPDGIAVWTGESLISDNPKVIGKVNKVLSNNFFLQPHPMCAPIDTHPGDDKAVLAGLMTIYGMTKVTSYPLADVYSEAPFDFVVPSVPEGAVS